MEFFNFRGTRFTILTTESGIPWWVAKELCDYLEIKNGPHAIKTLPADCKQRIVIDELKSKGRGGDNGVRIIINEPGLYRLLFRQPRSTGRENNAV